MIFFLLQLLGGFVSFLFPKLPDAMRAEYLKIHVFFGVFIFALAVGTCLMGIVEKLLFSKYVTTCVPCLYFKTLFNWSCDLANVSVKSKFQHPRAFDAFSCPGEVEI